MPMSFNAIAPTDYLEIEGIRIPKYGSVTLQEFLFLRDFFKQPPLQIGSELQIFADFQQRQVLATLLLISRSSPTWTLDEVAALFTVEQVYELSGFLIGEWLRWKMPKNTPEKATGEDVQVDWENVYWRLQLYYPNEPRFSAENIGNCPLSVIEAACDAYQQERKTNLHLQELGIATLTSVLININRSSKSRPVKPSDFYYFDTGAIQIQSRICNGFWSLAQSGKLPLWAIRIAPHDALKRGRSQSPAPELNYWIGEQIVILEPELEGINLFSPLALVNCADSMAIAYDSANTAYEIRLPDDCQGEVAVIEFEAEIVP